MHRTRWIPNRALAFAATLFALASCGGDTTEPGADDPDVAKIRISVGSQSVDLNDLGTVTGGPLALTVGANTVSVQFLKPDGQPEPLVTAAAYQINIVPVGDPLVTFVRSNTNPFQGNLQANLQTTGVLNFSLYHVEMQHNVFGPFPVSISVTQPGSAP